ncbi:hypothetical protein [Halosegnis sp.]|uniref:hypothetical protein n=1 Tax=Halosegnis sp. TaxID=2864959 RepID=UPI0035D42798
MEAVTEFGNALKDLSSERSYPTLRGHPPALELGDSLEIPDGKRAPSTGITIEVPESLRSVYTIAPLAYYLGATVEPGSTPRLRTDAGADFSLTARESLSATVRAVLRHIFTLDCLARTEGYYEVPLAERRAVSGLLDTTDETWESLYNRPVAQQVATYLNLPFEPVTEVAPEWRHTADIPADERGVEVLPFLTADLASIRCYDPDTEPTPGSQSGATSHESGATERIDETMRREESNGPPAGGEPVSRDDLFRIRDAPTPVQSYVGDGFPIGANKASRMSYEQQLTARADASSNAEVLVICNDPEMIAETDVEEAYASFELLPVITAVETDVSCAGLREAFSRDVDLLHYIGHVDSRGVQASDGFLDLAALETIGATAFILNGCRSFKQGSKLVDAGAIGGVVTLERVHNSLATEIGRHIARLVNAGWPLDQAMSLLEADALIGESYAVVGDGSTALVANAATPTSYTLGTPGPVGTTPTPPDTPGSATIEATIYTHPTRAYNLGTLFQSPVGTDDQYLSGGEIDTFTVSARELDRLFSDVTLPVVIDHERAATTLSLRWSDDLAGDINHLVDTVYRTDDAPDSLRGEDIFSTGFLGDDEEQGDDAAGEEWLFDQTDTEDRGVPKWRS